jgi:hypothetical protein
MAIPSRISPWFIMALSPGLQTVKPTPVTPAPVTPTVTPAPVTPTVTPTVRPTVRPTVPVKIPTLFDPWQKFKADFFAGLPIPGTPAPATPTTPAPATPTTPAPATPTTPAPATPTTPAPATPTTPAPVALSPGGNQLGPDGKINSSVYKFISKAQEKRFNELTLVQQDAFIKAMGIVQKQN